MLFRGNKYSFIRAQNRRLPLWLRRLFFLFVPAHYPFHCLRFLLLRKFCSYLLLKLDTFVDFCELFCAFVNNCHKGVFENIGFVNKCELQTDYVLDMKYLVFKCPFFFFFMNCFVLNKWIFNILFNIKFIFLK